MKGSRAKKPAAPWSPEQIERRPVSSLLPYARNARTHSEAQVAQIAASIREFGFTNPILVDGSSGIIAGHGRVLAAKLIGMAEVPVIELAHLSETQKRAYVIADNQLALNAGWDEGRLAAELGALKVEGFDLALTGFGEGELVAFFAVGAGGAEPESSTQEINPDDYEMQCACPKCGFEFDPKQA
jgi:hypothetical protein